MMPPTQADAVLQIVSRRFVLSRNQVMAVEVSTLATDGTPMIPIVLHRQRPELIGHIAKTTFCRDFRIRPLASSHFSLALRSANTLASDHVKLNSESSANLARYRSKSARRQASYRKTYCSPSSFSSAITHTESCAVMTAPSDASHTPVATHPELLKSAPSIQTPRL